MFIYNDLDEDVRIQAQNARSYLECRLCSYKCRYLFMTAKYIDVHRVTGNCYGS